MSDDHLPPPRSPQELRLLSAIAVMLGAGLFLALPFVLSIGASVFLPFVTAVVLSILLSPVADRLARWGVPNVIASLLALVFSVAVILVLLSLILVPAIDLFDRVPAMLKQLSAQASQLRGSFDWINDLNRQLSRLTGASTAREVVLAGPSVLEQVAFATPTLVLESIFTLLMAFFMIEARIRMRRHLLTDLSSGSGGLRLAFMISDVQDLVASYISTVGLINLGVGLIVTGGAWLLGFEYPVMWGGLAALLNFLPYIGPLIMTALIALFGLGTTDTVLAGLFAPACYLGLHAVEANVLTPAVLGRRFTLNPVMILLSISYFSWIWGVIGALLSVPILLILTAFFHHAGHPNVLGFFFGEPLLKAAADEAEQAVASEPDSSETAQPSPSPLGS